MTTEAKIEATQIVAAITLIGLAAARAISLEFASKTDGTFFTLVAVGLFVLLPVLFYAAYDWPRLIKFTRAARETFPEPSVSNSVADFVPKALLALVERRETTINVPSEKTPTDVQDDT